MHRSFAKILAALAVCALGAGGPAVALAGGPGGAAPFTGARATPSARAGDVTLHAGRSALVHHRHAFRGTAPARETVFVQRREGAGWTTVADTRARRDGTWSTAHSPRRSGRYRYRAALAGPRSADAAASWPEVAVTIYGPANATWYGPGLYGNPLACGGTLSRRTLGVANRTLPCGTRVAFMYRGRTVTVRVIDRGPFGPGASYDLTSATAKRLGMAAPSRVGVLVLR